MKYCASPSITRQQHASELYNQGLNYELTDIRGSCGQSGQALNYQTYRISYQHSIGLTFWIFALQANPGSGLFLTQTQWG